MAEMPDPAAPPADRPAPALPDLPTVVGLPGATIEREVGGQVCMGHGDEWPR